MKKILLIVLIAVVCFSLAACKDKNNPDEIGEDGQSFGEELEKLGAYDGYFEEEISSVTVNCVSGTADAYVLQDGVLRFGPVSEDSVYSVSGQLCGRIEIDVGDDYKLDLELRGFSLKNSAECPVVITSGSEVSITAKKGFNNYIYDERDTAAEDGGYDAAIYSQVDTEISGRGSLTVISDSNGGIHTKDDLQVKNLTLLVCCADNALKGNDSVTLESGATTLIATVGDAVKTSNTDVSEKGNQRGIVTVSGGTHTLYAACDGIDAAYDVIISDTAELTVYTDKYSSYSEEVTAVSEDCYYIRFTTDIYSYSVKYYNSDTDFKWVNAEYHSKASGDRNSYYYYSFQKLSEYGKMQFFIYSDGMEQGQADEYLVASDYLTPSDGYDTFALQSSGGGLYYSWTNYTTTVNEGGFGGPGGMGGHGGMGGINDGNTEKGDHSTKGLKAGNSIQISGGTVTVKSYDDAIHANADTVLENGQSPTGDVTVSGGILTLYSNDDGLHADGALTVKGGEITVLHSYEGAEGATVRIEAGALSLNSSDDGINATSTSGNSISISGGKIYVYAGGDGIDSNSRTSYKGISFSGGYTVIISTSGGNSAIDTEAGYEFTGGSVLAVMPSGGMTSEATHTQSFSAVGTNKSVSVKSGQYLTVKIDGEIVCAVSMPITLSGRAIFLGSSSAEISSKASSSGNIDSNGVFWKE